MSALIKLLIQSGAVKFGSFQTKSGRTSPYFINFGSICDGRAFADLCEHYAVAIERDFGTTVTNIYGPAYKGIPLSVGVAMALSRRLKRGVTFTFNRKELKDHGEGGRFVGESYSVATSEATTGLEGGRGGTVIVEDVLTGGTSLGETHEMLRGTAARVIGIVVGLDRQERGSAGLGARVEIEARFAVPVLSLLTITKLVQEASRDFGQANIPGFDLDRIQQYWQKYGISTGENAISS